MNLDKIRKAISAFGNKLKSSRFSDLDWLYYKQFESAEHRYIAKGEIDNWLDLLFTSDRTNRLWKREELRSSEVMSELATFDPDMVLTAFRELYSEERGLEGRIDRFKFYMEELLERKRRNSATFHESWHHQDNSIISYYLLMQFPEKYSYYTPQIHEKMVNIVGAKPLGESEDPVRYNKMVNTIDRFLREDENLIHDHLRRFSKPVMESSRLLVYEMIINF